MVLVLEDELWLSVVATEHGLAVVGDYAWLELVIRLSSFQLLEGQGQRTRLSRQ